MKNLILSLILVTLSAAPVTAQTYLRNTTLSATITSTQTQITLASGTGVEARGGLYVDHEYIPIVSCAVVACTTVNVNRIQKPAQHASAAVVYVASAALRPLTFLPHDGAQRMGQCSTSTSSTPGTALATMVGGVSALPIIDVDTGDLYMCRRNGTSGTWVWNVTNVQSLNGEAGSVPTTWP